MSLTTTVIEDISFNPLTCRTKRTFFEVPKRYEPKPSKKKGTRSNHLKGVRANVPKNHFFASLLIHNEINACLHKASEKDSLRKKMLKEYPNNKKAIYYYFKRFSEKRQDHNRGEVYASQQQPPLYCWYYNEAGYIIHPKARVVMGFEDCLLEVKARNFIDPRFFLPIQIETYRRKRLEGDPRHLSLHIPLQEDINKIEKAIGKPLYNSLHFPEGYGAKYK